MAFTKVVAPLLAAPLLVTACASSDDGATVRDRDGSGVLRQSDGESETSASS